jgi:hypothetical protein
VPHLADAAKGWREDRATNVYGGFSGQPEKNDMLLPHD